MQKAKGNEDEAMVYNARGRMKSRQEKVVEAHDDFNKAIELNPKMPAAYRNRGENLIKLLKTFCICW